MARRVDIDTWPRAGQYRLFRSFANPHFAITAPLDVTRLMAELKPRGVSPFTAVLYALTAGANAVPEFLTRFRGEEVVIHEAAGTSFTVPANDSGFVFCEAPYQPEWADFDRECRACIDAARAGAGHKGEATEGQDEWLFMSCLPWLDFSAMTHPVDGPQDCIPRIAWGRITRRADGRHLTPVAVQVHHALVDGEHVGAFFAAAQDALGRVEAG